nr:hypothetical protein TetV2_00644 [Oceanusvirus sp.]
MINIRNGRGDSDLFPDGIRFQNHILRIDVSPPPLLHVQGPVFMHERNNLGRVGQMISEIWRIQNVFQRRHGRILVRNLDQHVQFSEVPFSVREGDGHHRGICSQSFHVDRQNIHVVFGGGRSKIQVIGPDYPHVPPILVRVSVIADSNLVPFCYDSFSLFFDHVQRDVLCRATQFTDDLQRTDSAPVGIIRSFQIHHLVVYDRCSVQI